MTDGAAAKAPKKVRVGDQLGQWKLVDGPIGEGGNGRVFLGEDEKGTRAALKILWRHNPESVARFRREVEVVRRLPVNEHVVRVLDSGTIDEGEERDWYAMEYLPTGTLSTRKAEYVGQLEKAVGLVRMVANGVAFLHANGVLHRDLKPDNILFREGGVPVVADLGLCYLMDQDTTRLTPDDRATGAWGFRAPECEHERVENISASADVFSLVKMLWYIIHGGPLFASAHYEEERFDLARKFSDIGMNAVTVLMSKTIRANPAERRIRTAADLIGELDHILKLAAAPAGVESRLAIKVVQRVARDQAGAESAQKERERRKKLNASLKALLTRWQTGLYEMTERLNKIAVEAGGKAYLAYSKPSALADMRTGFGFCAGRSCFLLTYIEATGAEGVSLGQFEVLEVRGGHEERGAKRRRLVAQLVGDQAALFDEDKRETPLGIEEFWGPYLERVL